MGLFGKDVETMLKSKKNKVAKKRLSGIQAVRGKRSTTDSPGSQNESGEESITRGISSEEGRRPIPNDGKKHAHFEEDLIKKKVTFVPPGKVDLAYQKPKPPKTDRKTTSKIRIDNQFYDFGGMPIVIGDVMDLDKVGKTDLPQPRARPKSPKVPRIEQTALFDIEI